MPEVTFSLNDEQVKQEVPGQSSATPKDHKFLLTGVGNQNLVVFSEERGVQDNFLFIKSFMLQGFFGLIL